MELWSEWELEDRRILGIYEKYETEENTVLLLYKKNKGPKL